MDGEQEPIASVEPETPAIEQEVDETVNLQAPEQEPEESPPAEGALEPVEPEEELEEFEWEGKPIKGPKGLKDGVLRQADYTRKTQEVAATKRELEQRAATLDQQFQAAEEELDLRANLKAINAEIQKYADVDWQKLESEDIVGAQSHWRRLQQLKEAAQKASANLNTRVTERTEKAKQETANRLQETRQFAETQIKGWTPEVDAKVTEFAVKELGFDTDTLLRAYNPAVYKALHLAWIGHQAIQKPAAAPPAPKPAPQPLTVVQSKGNPAARKSVADMSMDEYVAYRKAQSR